MNRPVLLPTPGRRLYGPLRKLRRSRNRQRSGVRRPHEPERSSRCRCRPDCGATPCTCPARSRARPLPPERPRSSEARRSGPRNLRGWTRHAPPSRGSAGRWPPGHPRRSSVRRVSPSRRTADSGWLSYSQRATSWGCAPSLTSSAAASKARAVALANRKFPVSVTNVRYSEVAVSLSRVTLRARASRWIISPTDGAAVSTQLTWP